MNKTTRINDFVVTHRIPGYDVIKNPSRLSVAELVPIEISWTGDTGRQSIKREHGVDGLPLQDGTGIAVIEAPYDLDQNRAYIVNSDGSLRAIIDRATHRGRASFFDIFYVDGTLSFFAVASDRDIRVEVDESDGSIRRIIESR
ncbi:MULTISPECIES: hypothetical protein [unclassified Caballeronia]|uniref:hypothetical protein n=1 Tax=unclassified Caballeronia TaxID=2646786 RepID=UPI0020288D42|nr:MULTISPECIES: hypothetical protein [unclassified Caballeronia]